MDPWIPRGRAALAPAEQQLFYLLGVACVQRRAAPDERYRSGDVGCGARCASGSGQCVTSFGILCGCHHDVHAGGLDSAVVRIWTSLRIEQIVAAHIGGGGGPHPREGAGTGGEKIAKQVGVVGGPGGNREKPTAAAPPPP